MRKLLLMGLLLMLCATVVPAQSTRGSIYGTVKTQDGLVITGVEISLSSGVTAERTTVAGERGAFRFGELPVGEFTITCEKEGYQKVVREGVVVRMDTASRVEIVMEPSATEAVVTVSGEGAIVDMKKTGSWTAVNQDVLANIPTARDPWVIANQVAGVQMDRVNIGGSESGQQAVFMSHGSSEYGPTGGSGMWNVDGITITDMLNTGASMGYYDFDSFEEIHIVTSGADASVATEGISLNFITKQGSDTFHGQGSVYYTSKEYQSSNVPSSLAQFGYSGNRIDSIKDYGFDVGGPIWRGNLWFWGSYRIQDIVLLTITGNEDATELPNSNLKFTGQLGKRNRWTFLYTYSDKKKWGRNAAWNFPPECTWDQSGAINIFKVEDTHLVTDNLVLTGKFSYLDASLKLDPRGGRETITILDLGTGIFGGSFFYLEIKAPQSQLVLTGENYVEEAFGGSHEFKAGFEWRKTPFDSSMTYGGNMMKAYIFGNPFQAWFIADKVIKLTSMRTTFYLMDTFSRDRWTFNIGVRYDRQWGYNRPSRCEGVQMLQNIIPDLNYPGESSPFTWNDFVPRLGLTYDLFGDGKTVIRGNFSMYAGQLPASLPTNTNPLGDRQVNYMWMDLNGDNMPQLNELGPMTMWIGVDPTGQADPLAKPPVKIDSNLSAPRTTEFIIGAERELMPDLSLSANFIYRRFGNFWWVPEDGWSSADYYSAGTVTQAGYSATYYDSDKAHAFTTTVKQRPGYHQVYKALEIGITKRLSDKWMANINFNINNHTQHYTSPSSYQDPTNIDRLNGYYYVPELVAPGKGTVRPGSRWMLKASALYQLPWGINVSGFVDMREGFIYPIILQSPLRNVGGNAYVWGEPSGTSRLPNLTVADLRVEKAFNFTDVGRLDLILDIFNVFNTNTALSKGTDAFSSAFGRTTEIVSPRILRFGIRFRF